MSLFTKPLLKYNFLIICGGIYYLIISGLYINYPYSPDHAVYDYIGMVVNKGGSLYLDAADQNWPGQMFIHIASVFIFGAELWSYRAFEIIFILPLSVIILHKFLVELKFRFASYVVIPLYVGMYVTAGGWSSGQREMIAGPLLILAISMLYKRWNGYDKGVLFLQGGLVFLAILIRPTLLVMAPLLTLLDVFLNMNSKRRVARIFYDHCIVAITIVALLSILALLGYGYGNLQTWYEVSIKYNLEVYGAGTNYDFLKQTLVTQFIKSWHWYSLWSLMGLYFLWQRNKNAAYILLLLFPVTFISYFVQGKGFGYHLMVLLAPMAIFISCAIEGSAKLYQKRSREIIVSLILLFITTLPAIGMAKKLYSTFGDVAIDIYKKTNVDERYSKYTAGEYISIASAIKASEYLKPKTAADETILVWSRSLHINNYTQRLSPLFIASFALLTQPKKDFTYYDNWKQRIINGMDTNTPQFIVLVKTKGGKYVAMKNDNQDENYSAVIKSYLSKYELVKTIDNLDIFKLIH